MHHRRNRRTRRLLVLVALWTLSLGSLPFLLEGVSPRTAPSATALPGLMGRSALHPTIFWVEAHRGSYRLRRDGQADYGRDVALGLWLLLTAPAALLTWRWTRLERA